MLLIKAAAVSNIGKVRGNNEDNFYLDGRYLDKAEMDKGGLFDKETTRSGQIYAVCDGMGGENAGEEASYIMAKSLKKIRNKRDVNIREEVNRVVNLANDEMKQIRREQKITSMGTTLVLAYIKEDVVNIFHLGDSRCYLFREKTLMQMTEDHTEFQRMVKNGEASITERKTHPRRNRLTKYVGVYEEGIILEASAVQSIQLREGDSLLLCSDGLTDMLEDEEIATSLGGAGTVREKAAKLKNLALLNGARDNVTAVVIEAANNKGSSWIDIFKWRRK